MRAFVSIIFSRKIISVFAMLLIGTYFTSACTFKEKRTITQDGQDKISSISCIGSEKAPLGAVYLHGMDSVIPSDQEMQNRKILQDISEKYNIRIALPRASQTCAQSPNQICWGWGFDAIELSLVTNTIKDAETI
jgi:hypothetical protein